MPKTKILVVDDEPIIRNLCGTVLRTGGFDFIVVSNGLEGLEAYRERYEEICLVLTDVTMPVMGGVEMTRKIFEMHSHANVILMTGYKISDFVPDELRKLCSVIAKPFTPGRLLVAVRECLKYDLEQNPTNVEARA